MSRATIATARFAVADGIRRLIRPPVERDGPTALTQRRIYILPSRAGLWYGLLVLLLLLASVNFNVSLGFALCFLLAGLGLVGIWRTFKNLAGLRLQALDGRPVYAGDEATFAIVVHNPTRLVRYALDVRAGQGDVQSLDVPARSTSRVEVVHASTKRGWLDLEPLRVQTSYPLGLFRAWTRLPLPARCLVYPRPAAPAPLPQGIPDARREGQRSALGSDDFHGLRPYVQGDGTHRIAWKALAAGQGLFTKQFVAAASDEVWLDWSELEPLDTESRLSRLARWAVDADRNAIRFGLRIPGQVIPPGGGTDHLHRVLCALALFGLDS